MKYKFTALALMSAWMLVGPAQGQEKKYSRPELLIEPSQLMKPDVAKEYITLDARNRTKFKQGHVANARWVDR